MATKRTRDQEIASAMYPSMARDESESEPETKGDEQADDLVSAIKTASKVVWSRIRRTLQVKTRNEAAEMVAADPLARRLVENLLGGGDEEIDKSGRVESLPARKSKVTF